MLEKPEDAHANHLQQVGHLPGLELRGGVKTRHTALASRVCAIQGDRVKVWAEPQVGARALHDRDRAALADDAELGAVCEQAVKCCKVVGGGAACDNYKMMPVEGCRQTLDAQKQSAKAQGKSCDWRALLGGALRSLTAIAIRRRLGAADARCPN